MKSFCALLLFMTLTAARAAEEEFVSLFNGVDLNGWVNANCAPETWSVRDGVIHCTGRPTGAMRTTRQYENFILEVEWRHLSRGGNSGVFIWGTPIAAPGVPFLRGIEVQVLDHGYDAKGKNEWYTTHGDVFPIHGATMKPFGRHNGMRSFPSEEHSKGSPEWNHYRVVCSNGVLRLHVNGKEVSGGEDCNYRKGYLALESEGAPVEFRNIRIHELPSSGAAASLTAPLDQGWRALFSGLDLRGWTTNADTAQHWRVNGERLLRSGPAAEATLWSEARFGNAEFVIDCKPAKGDGSSSKVAPAVRLRAHDQSVQAIELPDAEPGKYQRYTLTVRGAEVVVRRDDREVRRVPVPDIGSARREFGVEAAGGAEFMNLYAREF